ncbi:MAG: signal peptide peptidase SppA [Bacteroidaceae bacterium]|nr:signal peptide peptidase SppA [Bacteroidaceae bacterium]
MKSFLKYVLATVVGLFVTGIIFSILSILSLVGMASMSSVKPDIEDNSVLVIKLNGTISERKQENPLAFLTNGSADKGSGLDVILTAIKNAKDNENVKGIYIEAGSGVSTTPAALQEIRKQLVDFKKSGKFILTYGETFTLGSYYVGSVADSVVINPQGIIDWRGMAMQTMYYKDLLDKIGVKMQIVKVGTYKSAVEPYILNDMSEANREQLTVLSSELWGEITADVSKSRKISVEKLNEYADSLISFADPTIYKKYKMVDKLAFSDEVPQIIANMMGVDKAKDYNTVSVTDMAAITNNEPKDPSGNIIAVYYATGEIVQEESSTSSLSQEDQIVGTEVIKDLKALADDEDVKAVVLRVNSPGGSAYASEQIWHQVMNIKAEKPIIVSMGGYAASGGYYISCAADWIVAEPNTITGSIGIFGMFPEASELLNDKLGVHTSTVKTNLHSDFGDLTRPLSEGERGILQAYVNRGYELFTKRCADGRKMKQDDIKAIGEGRVWTGAHAKKLGLVDQLGGINDAIAVAKKKAKVEKCTVMTYPDKKGIFDNLLDNATSTDSYADGKIREALGDDYYNMFSNIKNIKNKSKIQASMPFYLMFNL